METKSEEQIKRALEEIYAILLSIDHKVWTAPGDLYSLIDDYMEEWRKREISSSSTQEAGKELSLMEHCSA